MHILKVIFFIIAELAKQARAFPTTVAANFRKKQRVAEADEAEAERVDRIRHPSKYLGKES